MIGAGFSIIILVATLMATSLYLIKIKPNTQSDEGGKMEPTIHPFKPADSLNSTENSTTTRGKNSFCGVFFMNEKKSTIQHIFHILTGSPRPPIKLCCDTLEVFHTSEKLHNDINGSYINQFDVNGMRWYTNINNKWSIWWNEEHQYWVIGLATKKGTDQGQAFLSTNSDCFKRNTSSDWLIHDGKKWKTAELEIRCQMLN